MPKSVDARLTQLEKALGKAGDRYEFSLHQLVQMARGLEAGPPAELMRPGEKSVGELILECRGTGP